MKAFRQGSLTLLASLVPGSLPAAFHPRRPPWSEETLLPGEERIQTVLAWGQDVQWIDARSAKEYEAEHVPGAILLNLEDWDQLFPKFLDQWNPEKKVVVYCSSTACELIPEAPARLKKPGLSPSY